MQTLANQIQLNGGKPPSSRPIPPRIPSSYGGPTPPGGQPYFHILPRGQPPFASHTLVVNPPLVGGQPSSDRNPSQSLGVSCKGTFTQPHVGGTLIITHNEEYQILFLLNHLMDNLIRATSQTPPRVLKDKNLILPMDLMYIGLRDLLLTLLKGTMFILFLGKQITWIIMLITYRVMQMFLSHHQILFILVNNNRM
jgi:hypothetical protein